MMPRPTIPMVWSPLAILYPPFTHDLSTPHFARKPWRRTPSAPGPDRLSFAPPRGGNWMSIKLAQASTIVDVALQKGRELNLRPLVVAVLDAGGHLVAYKREDKSAILRFEIAYGKAYAALGMGFGSRGLFERAQKAPMFITTLSAVSNGRVMAVPGGVLIQDQNGDTIGAVGISGDTSDNDEACAVAGISAAGLKAETGLGKG